MRKHFFREYRWLLAAGALVGELALCASAAAMDLITAEEAALPTAPRATRRGGITRGPSIKVVSPDQNDSVRAPFAMKLDFQAHGGSKIDVSSVRVTYLKNPGVDLTPRLKSAISQSGIRLADANAPAGIHDLKVDVADTQGRTASEIVRLTVVK